MIESELWRFTDKVRIEANGCWTWTGSTSIHGYGRRAVGVELNPEYAALCAKRTQQQSLLAEAVG